MFYQKLGGGLLYQALICQLIIRGTCNLSCVVLHYYVIIIVYGRFVSFIQATEYLAKTACINQVSIVIYSWLMDTHSRGGLTGSKGHN